MQYTLPDGRQYSEKTDENGEIKIEFDPSGFMPGRHLSFHALANAYNVGTQDHVFLANLGFNNVVTPAPVFIGDTLRARSSIKELRESKSRPEAGIVTFTHELLNQRDEVVCRCERSALLKRSA